MSGRRARLLSKATRDSVSALLVIALTMSPLVLPARGIFRSAPLSPSSAAAAGFMPLDPVGSKYWSTSPLNYGYVTRVTATGTKFVLRGEDYGDVVLFRLTRVERSGVVTWDVPLALYGEDEPRMEIDTHGGVYVCGASGAAGEFSLLKIDQGTGAEVWRKDYGAYDTRIPASISLDAGGAIIYVCMNYDPYARILRVFTDNGDSTVFADTANSVEPGSKLCAIFDIAANAPDCVYAVGHVEGALAGKTPTKPDFGGAYAVIKYDYAGNVQWTQQGYNADPWDSGANHPTATSVEINRLTGDAMVLVNQAPYYIGLGDFASQWYLMRFGRRFGTVDDSLQLSRAAGERSRIVFGGEAIGEDIGTAMMTVDGSGTTYLVVKKPDKIVGDSYWLSPYLMVYGSAFQERKVFDTRTTFEDLTIGESGYLYLTGTTCEPLDGPVNPMYTYGAYYARFAALDVDTDGDGLLDRWETQGFTGEKGGFVDLPKMGADPFRKDIFVEIDYMQGMAPSLNAIDRVVDAFANADQVENPDGTTGITLHVDNGPYSVMNPKTGDHWDAESRQGVVPNVVFDYMSGFSQLKGTDKQPGNFDYERWPIFHYCIFGDMEAHRHSGMSDGIGASDFFVTLGGFSPKGGTEQVQAGTFMHELGHNLGLMHGGPDSVHYKPNYLSIMNYAFQFGGLSKVVPGTPEPDLDPGYLDYSRFGPEDIATLDETNLDERAGIWSPNGNASINDYFTCLWTARDSSYLYPIAGPKDWNANSQLDSGNVGPFNINPGDSNGPNYRSDEKLESWNDWIHINYEGGCIGKGIASSGVDILPLEDSVDANNPANQAAPRFRVEVTAPANSGLKPGSSTSLKFTVANTGSDDDTYTVSAGSSAGWSDVSGFPQQIELAGGAVRNFEVPISAPAGAGSGEEDQLTLTAQSTIHDLLRDSKTTVTMAAKESSFVPVKIPNPTGGGQDQLDGELLYSLPTGYVAWPGKLFNPRTQTESEFPFPTDHYIYPAIQSSWTDRPYGNVDNARVPVTTADDYTYPSKYYFGVADLKTGTMQYASLPTTSQVSVSRLSGDNVAFIESSKLDNWPWSIDRLKVWNLKTDTMRLLWETNIADGIDPNLDDFSGARMVWANGAGSSLGTGPGVWCYDISSDSLTNLSPVGDNVKISGEHAIWTTESDTPSPGVYLYLHDFGDGSTTRIAGPLENYFTDIHTRYVVWITGATAFRDVMLYDMVTGSTTTVASNVESTYYSSYWGQWRTCDGPTVNGSIVNWADTKGHYCAVIPVESVAPKTSATVAPSAPDAGQWYSSTPTVTLTADRPNTLSYYQFDGTDDAGWIAYKEPFPVPDGDHTVYFYSADKIGNKEAPQDLKVKVDTTAPASWCDFLTDAILPGTTTHSEAPTLTISASEPGTTYYQWDSNAAEGWLVYPGELTAPEGEHTLYFYAEDECGHTGAVGSQWFDVDTAADDVPPVVQLTTSFEPDQDGIFRLRPQALASVDETAGIYFRWDSSEGVGEPPVPPARAAGPLAPGEEPSFEGGDGWSIYMGPIFVPEGAHTLYAYAVDVRGNRSEVVSLEMELELSQLVGPPVLDTLDNRSVVAGEVLEFGLSALPSAHDGLAYSAEGLPEGATLDPATGEFWWMPTQAQVGEHEVTFGVSDGDYQHSRTILITVLTGNRSPSTSDVSVSTTANTAVPVTLSASDLDGDPLTWLQSSPPTSGTLLGTAPNLTYVPNTGFVGADEFAYQVSDGKGGTATAHVTVSVLSRGNPVPVYRFFNPGTGAHFYTSDAKERDSVIANLSQHYRYEGVAYVVDPNKNTQPLYRFYNRFTRVHFFTASPAERESVLATRKDFAYEGEVFKVSTAAAPDKTPCYRFLNKRTGTHFYTISETEKNTVVSKWPHIYNYEGTAFWLGH